MDNNRNSKGIIWILIIAFLAGCQEDKPVVYFDKILPSHQISYISYCPPKKFQSYLCLMDIDGKNKAKIILEPGLDPFWSPDGEKIAFSWYDKKLKKMNIWIVDIRKKTIEKITDGEDDFFPSWSPDGKRIVYKSKGEDQHNLWIIDLNNRNKKMLRNTAYTMSPSFSPDGKKILVRHTKEKVYYFIDVETEKWEKVSVIPFPKENFYGLSISPDGKKMLFSADPPDKKNREIFVINSDGTNLKRLTDNDVFDTSPSWSPDGKKIVFSRTEYKDKERVIDIWIMDANGSNERKLTDSQPDDIFNITPRSSFRPIPTKKTDE